MFCFFTLKHFLFGLPINGQIIFLASFSPERSTSRREKEPPEE